MPKTKISRVGNSASVRLSQAVLAESGFAVDQTVDVSAEKGRVIIQPTDDVAGNSAKYARECAARYRRTLEKLGE